MPQTIHHRLHILEAADWKDGVITLLEPRSPYRPWRYAFGESRPGDCVLLVLGTDPVSVLTSLGRIDHDGGFGGALVSSRRWSQKLVDLTTLAMMCDLDDPFVTWRFDDDDAERLILALHESRVPGSMHHRWGHSSVAAARNLLQFNGRCDGCDHEIDLTEDDARDHVHVHTADPLPRPAPPSPIRTDDGPAQRWPDRYLMRHSARDWPAVLCRRCRDRMHDGNFRSFIDFRFAQHPACARCGGQRTQAIGYGEPVSPDWAPWLHKAGCCVRDEKWHCELCEHEWV
ncbi:hypothetical protein [Mycolicibacterium phocaicum]|nr:hypothetical protein [Mycolicibacterium phocaicum]BBZ55211.1 hypothetical protein MPHO_22030 [Mycolicibacterium phocaicum]